MILSSVIFVFLALQISKCDPDTSGDEYFDVESPLQMSKIDLLQNSLRPYCPEEDLFTMEKLIEGEISVVDRTLFENFACFQAVIINPKFFPSIKYIEWPISHYISDISLFKETVESSLLSAIELYVPYETQKRLAWSLNPHKSIAEYFYLIEKSSTFTHVKLSQRSFDFLGYGEVFDPFRSHAFEMKSIDTLEFGNTIIAKDPLASLWINTSYLNTLIIPEIKPEALHYFVGKILDIQANFEELLQNRDLSKYDLTKLKNPSVSNIKSFELAIANFPDALMLACLPGLESLDIGFELFNMDFGVDLPCAYQPHLKKLKLRVEHTLDLKNLFASIANGRFTALDEIQIDVVGGKINLRKLMRDISPLFLPSSPFDKKDYDNAHNPEGLLELSSLNLHRAQRNRLIGHFAQDLTISIFSSEIKGFEWIEGWTSNQVYRSNDFKFMMLFDFNRYMANIFRSPAGLSPSNSF